MPEEATVEEAPETTTELANQIKAQTDSALAAIDPGSAGGPDSKDMGQRLDAAFAKAGLITNPATGQTQTPEPKPEKAAATKEAEPEKPAAERKSVTSKLMQKKEVAKPEATKGKDPEWISQLLNGIESKSAEERIRELARNLKETNKRIAEEYEPKTKGYTEKIAELEKQVASVKDSKKFQDEIKLLTEQNAVLDAIVKRTSIEHHPKFKAEFDDRIAEKAAKAKEIVGESLADALDTVLSAKNARTAAEAWDAIKEEVGDFKAQQLLVLKNRIDELNSDRARELEKWKENATAVEKMEEAKQTEMAQMREAELTARIERTIADITSPDADIYVFRKLEGEDEWNKGVEARLAEFQRTAKKPLTAADQVELAKRAASADGAFAVIDSLIEDMKSLQAELDGIKKATPGFGKGRSSSIEGKDDPNETWSDRVVRMASEAGAFAK